MPKWWPVMMISMWQVERNLPTVACIWLSRTLSGTHYECCGPEWRVCVWAGRIEATRAQIEFALPVGSGRRDRFPLTTNAMDHTLQILLAIQFYFFAHSTHTSTESAHTHTSTYDTPEPPSPNLRWDIEMNDNKVGEWSPFFFLFFIINLILISPDRTDIHTLMWTVR